jgi:hypothetical protein
MNEETLKALKQVVSDLHHELNKIKKVGNKYQALLNLNIIERWIYENAKEHEPISELLVD